MSAFLCSDVHISAIVNASRLGTRRGYLNLTRYLPSEIDPLGRTDEERMFDLLLDTNLQSLEARYPGNGNLDEWTTEPDSYRYRWDANVISRHGIAGAIKLLHCYEYQSCEHEGWEESQAHRFARDLSRYLVAELPGYEDAPWAFDGN